MITGLSPRISWRLNPDGVSRSIEEAVAIARKHGVEVPEDVEFFVDDSDCLESGQTARGPRITKPAGAIVYWSDHLNRRGKVPFLIHPSVLHSDEAIVAVFAHEMHELESLRPLLRAGNVSVEHYGACTSPSNPGNFHDQAWDVADDLVEQMRGERDDNQ